VTVYDREEEWFVDGGGGGRRGGRERDGDRFRVGDRFAGGDRFGGGDARYGGGYVRRRADTADVDVEAVEALIEERTMLRRERDFTGADAVRDVLADEYGVTVHDREEEWFVDAGRGGNRGGSRAAPSTEEFGKLGHDYKRELFSYAHFFSHACFPFVTPQVSHLSHPRLPTWHTPALPFVTPQACHLSCALFSWFHVGLEEDGAPLSAADFEPINALLAARLLAKLERRFSEADLLLEELQSLGVAVDDRRKLWRADGVDFKRQDGWTRIEGDGDGETEVDEAQVLDLIGKRGEAKSARNYELADAFCDELREKHAGALS